MTPNCWKRHYQLNADEKQVGKNVEVEQVKLQNEG